MTTKEKAHYIGPMEIELSQLESRIEALAQLCHQLRGENRQLRQAADALSMENRVLHDKIERAGEKLEQLLSQLPEEAA